MLQIHPNARTTPAVRAEIARSDEPSGMLAKRYGVSSETIRKWRKRGPEDCLDHSARPYTLPWKATDEERAVVCALRRATNFALDDLTFVVTHFLPHLNRDSIWRILRAEGISRRPPPSSDRPRRGEGRFKDYDPGFIHIDIKHLPKLQTANGERRKRFLSVAIDRCSRSVHLAVKDDDTERSAIAFLREAAAAFPFRLAHVLTDNGSGFTPAFARVCAELGAEYRHTKPRSPQTTDEFEQPLSASCATDEFEQPLSASCATFLGRMGDRVAKSGAWRWEPRRAAYGRSSVAASMRARRGPLGCQPVVRRS
jgi:transposase